MALRDALRHLAVASERSPRALMQWTPPQQAFYLDPAPRKSFRAGNQIGKSYGGLRWLIDLAEGKHPDQFRPPPLECWIVCTSWSQSVAIMGKFRSLIDVASIDEGASSNFSTRNGYGKDNPAVILRNGSVVRFRTTRQGPTALQGATCHVVLIDEPTSLDIYRELDRRLTRTGGLLGCTFTPANVDCRWIRELTEAGILSETHADLTVANLTPIGSSEPFQLLTGRRMDQAWIDEQWANTPAAFADVVLSGAWEGKPMGAFFQTFDRGKHARSGLKLSPSKGPIRICLGVDHAAAGREYGQAAVLCQVQQWVDSEGALKEAINVVDECVAVGSATSEEFGRHIASMLRRHGLVWRDLWRAYGDIPAASRIAYKSNAELARSIARVFGMHVNNMRPRIDGAKEGRGAAGLLDTGCRYIYAGFANDLINVHPRCKLLIEALESWDITDPKYELKDVIDALRYALKDFVLPFHAQTNVSVRIG